MSQTPRRFYKDACVRPDGREFLVMLDARTLRTPGGTVFRAPTRQLAQACAKEWAGQGERIAPSSMPLTQLGFVAIDATPKRRQDLAKVLVKYIETDLVCHRASAPASLAARQSALWDPILDWAEARFQFRLPVVAGVVAAEVSPQNLARISTEIDALDHFRCTALAQAITLAGSALIGFALIEGRLDAEAAFAAAAFDELWSLENWGEDSEARAKLERQRAEFAAIAAFAAALATPQTGG